MEAVVFSFTRKGAQLSLKLQDCLEKCGYHTKIETIEKFADIDERLGIMQPNHNVACGRYFKTARVIVFVGATGIAVRTVAPFVVNKALDPAVISIDELGLFVIPLLSGHIGGANALAIKIAEYIEGTPVVTTATDINNLFSVDEWATKNKMAISSLEAAKSFAAYLVDGKKVFVKSDFPIVGKVPDGMEVASEGEVGIAISLTKFTQPFIETLVLRPKILHLGIGCRRGTSAEDIDRFVTDELRKLKMTMTVVKRIASINVKQDEEGLLEFALSYGFPVNFYSAEDLNKVPGEFTPSEFVKETVGVDNVCERSAVLSSGNGNLLLQKTSSNGITLAIAVEKYEVDFEK